MKQLRTREVYRNPWISVREDDIERSDGSIGLYGVVDKQDFALVIPQEDDGFWLVEQYRYPAQQRGWEFPQGTWGAGSSGSAVELAAAELREETGLQAEQLRHLGRLCVAYGLTSQRFDVYLATGLTHGEPEREASEQDMEQAFVTEAEFVRRVRSGELVDSCTVAAYGLLVLDRQA